MYHFFFNDSCDKMLPMLCLLLRMAPQHLLGLSIVEEKDLVSVEETECNREMWPHGMLFTESRSNRTDWGLRAAAATGETVSRCAIVQRWDATTTSQSVSLSCWAFLFLFSFPFPLLLWGSSVCFSALYVFYLFFNCHLCTQSSL